ncbi:MAG: hypothetical protein KIT09_09205 [Bryobacteraceae bacterium]|nr:hypothetical protein [Bryobacteraceae bacterium]
MSALVFVAAERRELAGMLRRLPRPVPLQWPVESSWAAEWRGRHYLLVANGFGPGPAVEALEVARARADIAAVISTGFCGALNAALKPADIFVAAEVRTRRATERFTARLPRTGREYVAGILLSGDSVIQSAEEKRALRASGGDAVEMEAAPLAARSVEWRVPFYCVRAVTDTAGESFSCDFNAARRVDGRLSYGRLLLSACRKPGECLPELWRLRKRSRSAAEALGDFLVHCEF